MSKAPALANKDKQILRDLASRTAEAAALPVQEEKRELWRKLNGCRPERPMVMIDQVCWNELSGDEELTLQCADEECRGYEQRFRRILYQWNHFPVDMVVEPVFHIPNAIHNSGFGITREEDTVATDENNPVVAHSYKNQLETDEDLEKIRMPEITHDASETERRVELAEHIFGDLLDVRPAGTQPYLSLWDPIATWMGVENALFALMDRPDFMHRLLERMSQGYLSMLDQLEEQRLLCEPQSVIHCTGAHTEELPAQGYTPQKPRTKDIWMFGLAQMLGTVSPDMFREFEIDYMVPICERFGLVYYGCCDPLHDKMNEVRMLPHVRKVSMSPWVNQEQGAAGIGKDFVFSRKPSPSMLAGDELRTDEIRDDLRHTRNICQTHGCPLEFILKDLSTVRYEPQRLSVWAEIAMEVAKE